VWDFLVGDNPTVLVATVVVVGGAFALRHVRAVAVVVLPALVVGFLVLSTAAHRRKVRRPEGPSS
jgi:hypothetical protein